MKFISPTHLAYGFIFGISFVISFTLATNASVPLTTGQAGVPVSGYVRDLLSKILVVGTTTGEVKDARNIDGIPGSNIQKAITGACPVGQWAIGINLDNSIKCSIIVSVPGACGTANGQTLASAPSGASLCAVGSTASSVTGTGPWNWSCTNGTTVNCQALKSVPTCTPNGTCSAPVPACETTTTGVDNCGGACTRTGGACPPASCVPNGTCSAAAPNCNFPTTYGTDNCGDSCTRSIPSCRVDGVCGPAHNTTYTGNSPTLQLCSPGSPRITIDNRPTELWWTCDGAYGGTSTPSCYARKQ